MHKDEAKGAAKDVKGSIKEAAGRATNDPNLEAEGSADKVEGKVQKGVGALKDAARDVLKHSRPLEAPASISAKVLPRVSRASRAATPVTSEAAATYTATAVPEPVALSSATAISGASEPATIEVTW